MTNRRIHTYTSENQRCDGWVRLCVGLVGGEVRDPQVLQATVPCKTPCTTVACIHTACILLHACQYYWCVLSRLRAFQGSGGSGVGNPPKEGGTPPRPFFRSHTSQGCPLPHSGSPPPCAPPLLLLLLTLLTPSHPSQGTPWAPTVIWYHVSAGPTLKPL